MNAFTHLSGGGLRKRDGYDVFNGHTIEDYRT
jgi:hypothetical protein